MACPKTGECYCFLPICKRKAEEFMKESKEKGEKAYMVKLGTDRYVVKVRVSE